MGFKPTKYDPDVYMRLAEDGHSYDYIGCHTDDLTIVAADAQQVLNQLLGHYVKGCHALMGVGGDVGYVC